MPSTQGIVNEIKVKNKSAEISESLHELIKSHVESINKMKDELKQVREMHTDSFANNPTYREKEEKAKEAIKEKKQVKEQIAKSPDVAQLDQKVKDLRFDIKESQKTLSDLLLDYQDQTGATQLDIFGGTLAIVKSAKLVVAK